MKKTKENGIQYEFSLDHALEFFSKAGSLFIGRQSFYQDEESALSLFQKSWVVEKEISMKLLFWLRDCRGGAGNRSGFRECINWLASDSPEWVEANIHLVPVHGRWDDLRALFGTPCESEAARLWANALLNKEVLAAKWADRKDKPLRHQLHMNEKFFRKLLASIRKNHIVEHKMCHNLWKEIEYDKVPSVTMARYTNAFSRHDSERFERYKEALKQNKATIKADVLFPHDCVRTAFSGDTEIADAQFEALPNYMENTDEKVIVIADTSGSMSVCVSGSIQAVDISQGLALYCSAKIPKDNPFHKKFLSFSNEGEFKDWNGMTFSQAVRDQEIFDGAIGTTRIDKALDLILKTAKFFNLTQDQMPTMLLIVSDMQFHSGVRGDGTEVEKALKKWIKAGYEIPQIVYWNTAGYAGSPATVKSKNIGLVSGFSPSILKSILVAEDFRPESIMLRTLEKYEVIVPMDMISKPID